MTAAPVILLISGSTRSHASNTAALRTVAATAPEEVSTVLYERLADLPAFNPDLDPPGDPSALPPIVAELRAQLATAGGVMFCTPEYAGALPGSFKNLLDWTVGGGEMDRKPVAWIDISGEGRGQHAHASLATVLEYLGTSIVEPACARIPLSREAIGPDGTIVPGPLRELLAAAVRSFAERLGEAPVR
jgi:chromate reductase